MDADGWVPLTELLSLDDFVDFAAADVRRWTDVRMPWADGGRVRSKKKRHSEKGPRCHKLSYILPDKRVRIWD